MTFFHGAMGSVVPSTWIRAIKNNQFASWPGLTFDLVTKHLSPLVVTAEGHQKQEFQNLQSTKTPMKSIKLQKEKPNLLLNNQAALSFACQLLFWIG